MTRSQAEFYELTKEYKAAADFFEANVLTAETDQENGIFVLREVLTRLMSDPCTTPAEMVRKVSFILSEDFLVEWLGEEKDFVRMLLSSFMCLKDA